jgi:cytochrome c
MREVSADGATPSTCTSRQLPLHIHLPAHDIALLAATGARLRQCSPGILISRQFTCGGRPALPLTLRAARALRPNIRSSDEIVRVGHRFSLGYAQPAGRRPLVWPIRGARPTGVDQVSSTGETMRNRTICVARTRAVLINSLCAIATFPAGASVSLAAGDRAAGQQFFATHCSPCHATDPGVNKTGPSLAGVVGRKSGSEAGYNYSAALKAANITWDDKAIDKWLQSPTGDVHGAKMFITVPNAGDRQNVIAYLETLK